MLPSMSRADDLRQLDLVLTRIGRAANSRRTARTRAERSGIALTPPAVATLSAIYRAGPLRARDAGEIADLEPPRVSREVRTLVEAGLVEVRDDPADRRASLLAVTPAGRQAFERYRRTADEMLAELMQQWSDADLHALTAMLSRLADGLGDLAR